MCGIVDIVILPADLPLIRGRNTKGLYGWGPLYLIQGGDYDMSDYVYAMRFDREGCPECGGDNKRQSKTNFSCEDCSFAFP